MERLFFTIDGKPINCIKASKKPKRPNCVTVKLSKVTGEAFCFVTFCKCLSCFFNWRC